MGSVLEQGTTFGKGMAWLATNDAWPRQMSLFVRGKGLECDIDLMGGKISRMVILINLDGVKAMIDRIEGRGRDQIELLLIDSPETRQL